ncbi:MAG TPA: SDR family oxidoreductase [Acidimicrobiales bacterium]|nr:SDR family oxidoreductase [Acidimicrobiales bacterium]
MSSTRGGDTVLTGRAALVTGASRGIGLACARAFAAAGVRVAMLARSEVTLRAEARAIGLGALPVVCDLSRTDSAHAAVQEVESAFGGAPDIILNNAGLFTLAPLESTSPAEFARTVDTNLVAPFTILHAFLPAMRARRSGHIVTVGSIADRHALPENAAYAASKFGLRGLHEVLRGELRGSGVRASLVSPGPVDTPLWDPVDPDQRPGFTPRAAMLSVEAVAAAVLYVVTQPADVNVDELRLSRS